MQSDRKELIPYRAADPAQSAPSAESTCWLKLKALLQKWNPNTPLCTKDDCPSCQSLRAEIFAELEAYAALRTAQLEKEVMDGYDAIFPHVPEVLTIAEKINKLIARAETAESALWDARERIEKDVQILNVCYGFISQVWSANPLDSPNEKSAHALLVRVNKELTNARALLTVAAQTPEEKNG